MNITMPLRQSAVESESHNEEACSGILAARSSYPPLEGRVRKSERRAFSVIASEAKQSIERRSK
jgi:hypothetical protein